MKKFITLRQVTLAILTLNMHALSAQEVPPQHTYVISNVRDLPVRYRQEDVLQLKLKVGGQQQASIHSPQNIHWTNDSGQAGVVVLQGCDPSQPSEVIYRYFSNGSNLATGSFYYRFHGTYSSCGGGGGGGRAPSTFSYVLIPDSPIEIIPIYTVTRTGESTHLHAKWTASGEAVAVHWTVAEGFDHVILSAEEEGEMLTTGANGYTLQALESVWFRSDKAAQYDVKAELTVGEGGGQTTHNAIAKLLILKANLLVDTNRDGVVNEDDEDGKDDWTLASGAFIPVSENSKIGVFTSLD